MLEGEEIKRIELDWPAQRGDRIAVLTHQPEKLTCQPKSLYDVHDFHLESGGVDFREGHTIQHKLQPTSESVVVCSSTSNLKLPSLDDGFG